MGAKERRRKENLFHADPYCWYCGREVFLGAKDAVPHKAVLHHLKSKRVRQQEQGVTVLSCYECANERAWRHAVICRKRVKRKTRREELMRMDPHCWYCGIEVWEPHETEDGFSPDMATLDHLVSKIMADHGYNRDGHEFSVLACAECNKSRSEWEVLLLGKDEIRRRSGAWPCECSCFRCVANEHDCDEFLCNRNNHRRHEEMDSRV